MDINKKNSKKKILIIISIVILISLLLLLFKSCSKAQENKADFKVYSNDTKEVAENNNIKEENKQEDSTNQEDVIEDVSKDKEEIKELEAYSYYVNFLNIDGTVLQRTVCKEGELPSYKGTIPTYKDGIYSYTFTGWDKTFTKVTTTQSYTAVYKKEAINNEPNKATPTVTAPTANTPTYTGSAQALVIAGSTTGGTLKYKLGTDGTYSTDIPTATNADTYTVYYKVEGDSNYNDVAEKSINVIINKATLIVTPKSNQNKTYDGSTASNITYDYSGNIAGQTPDFVGTLALKDSAINAGTYKIIQNTLALKDNGSFKASNYTLSFIDTVDYIINKLGVDEPLVSGTYTYNGSEQTVTLTGVETYMSTSSSLKATNAGDYNIVYTLDDNHKWNDGSDGTVTWTINKAKVTVPSKVNGTLTYNSSEQTGVVLPDNAKYTLTNNKKTNAGSYTATATLSDKDNYEWDLTTPTSDDQNIDFSIEKKTITVTADDKSSYYGSDLVTLTYTNDSLYSGDSFTGQLSTSADKNVTGTYDIVQGTLSAGENYSIAYTKGTYTVKAKEEQSLSFADSSLTKTYGDSSFTNTLTGAQTTVTYSSSDTSKASVDSSTGEVTIHKAGSVTINAIAESNYKYKQASASYTLTINKAKVTVPSKVNGTLTYNSSEQTGVVLPDNAKYTLTNNKKTNAGSYTATATLSDKDNYEWDLTTPTSDDQTINWSIAKRDVTFTSESTSKAYDGTELTYNFMATSGLIQGHWYDLTFTGSIKNVGSTENSFTLDLIHDAESVDVTANYEITKEYGTLTVTKATTSITNLTLADWTYGTKANTPTANTNFGAIIYKYSDSESGIYSSTVPTDAGTYYVKASVEGTSNYTSAEETKSFKINKADQTAPSAPTYASATSNSLTVNAITTTGHGDVEYAVNTTNTAPTTGWQTSTTFTGLTEGTAYYFFARYAGDDNYNVSSASTGANLGLGYCLVLNPNVDCSMGGYNKSMAVIFADGSSENVQFVDANAKDTKAQTIIDTDDKNLKISEAYTYTNVASLSRKGDYIQYYIGNNSTEIYTWDFGNGVFKLPGDITITKVGIANCIDENSLITMADGSLKAMKDIEVGDEVLSIDYETMTLVSRKVIYTGKDEADYDNWTVASYYLHTFSDGTVIKRAMRHRFYCLEEKGYKHMDYWENGLHAYKIDGTNPELVSTEIIQEELHYGRITLEDSNNYFANGLSTGDSECCPYKVTLNEKLELAIEN